MAYLCEEETTLVPLLYRDTCVSLSSSEELASLESILLMQTMLSTIAQREIGYIMSRQELVPQTEKVTYDYFIAMQRQYLYDAHDWRAPHTTTAHSLLLYRLKHMLYLRISYLILQQHGCIISQLLKACAHKHSAPRAEQEAIIQEQEKIQDSAQVCIDMLASSGDIACAIAEDIWLHMRSKLVVYALNRRQILSHEGMRILMFDLLSEKHKAIRTYITHESIQHSLSVHRLSKLIVATI